MNNISWHLKEKISNSPPGRMGTWNKLEFFQCASNNPKLTGLVNKEAFQSLVHPPTHSDKAGGGPSARSRLPFLNSSYVQYLVHQARVASHFDKLNCFFILASKRFTTRI